MEGDWVNITPFLFVLGMVMVILGMVIMFLGFMGGEPRVWAGGLVMIGPIPLFFGGEGSEPLLLALLIPLTLFLVILFLMLRRGLGGE